MTDLYRQPEQGESVYLLIPAGNPSLDYFSCDIKKSKKCTKNNFVFPEILPRENGEFDYNFSDLICEK